MKVNIILLIGVLSIRRSYTADVFGWLEQAANDVKDWTADAGKGTAKWTASAADDIKDWTVEAGKDTAKWTASAATDVKDWTVEAGKDSAKWTATAASDVKNSVLELPNVVLPAEASVTDVKCSPVTTFLVPTYIMNCNPHAFIRSTYLPIEIALEAICRGVDLGSNAVPIVGQLASLPLINACLDWMEWRIDLFSHVKGDNITDLKLLIEATKDKAGDDHPDWTSDIVELMTPQMINKIRETSANIQISRKRRHVDLIEHGKRPKQKRGVGVVILRGTRYVRPRLSNTLNAFSRISLGTGSRPLSANTAIIMGRIYDKKTGKVFVQTLEKINKIEIRSRMYPDLLFDIPKEKLEVLLYTWSHYLLVTPPNVIKDMSRYQLKSEKIYSVRSALQKYGENARWYD